MVMKIGSDVVSGSALPRTSRDSEMAAARALLRSGVSERDAVLLTVADRMLRDMERLEEAPLRPTPQALASVVVRSHRRRETSAARV